MSAGNKRFVVKHPTFLVGKEIEFTHNYDADTLFVFDFVTIEGIVDKLNSVNAERTTKINHVYLDQYKQAYMSSSQARDLLKTLVRLYDLGVNITVGVTTRNYNAFLKDVYDFLPECVKDKVNVFVSVYLDNVEQVSRLSLKIEPSTFGSGDGVRTIADISSMYLTTWNQYGDDVEV